MSARLCRPGLAAALLATLMVLVPLRPAAAEPNPVTPGDFKGFGFDQCLAPNQKAMDTWLDHSPFLSVGIYISGDSRACRSQPNLTPRWIRTQLRKGWRLLPITLGPQASCSDRFPRYGNDPVINGRPGRNGKFPAARKQGRAEAVKAVDAAKALGIVPRSTLWYDLEAFDEDNYRCRESALAFLSAWTDKLHDLRYVSGVYSSAGSGIAVLDDARVERPGTYTMPDMVWIARWDGVANTSTSYIRNDGWRPGGRVKQYTGGHDETWGGVTINIDRNYLDLGKGRVAEPEEHCGGVNLDFARYPAIRQPGEGAKPPVNKVRALQCLLQERGVYDGKLNGRYNAATVAAVGAWQKSRGFAVSPTWSPANWVAAFAQGRDYAQKIGSTGPHVRRAQRALNAANSSLQRKVDGIFKKKTAKDVKAYQRKVGLKATGIVNRATWERLRAGRS
ncbi:peptidoglycan-binding protein [Nocardioides silvaticus]|uniref:Peptidoglycan-binding protein n=1 Tax=Nocardioides silvaticus TaxID=2201891 RepID=A0A316TF43_9ACTN|nr:glycoside hydrolase domain-containing protein [Nocardioides silvaticus]PWN01112.1 peptidoglycan-binding protein [Nocardioides silvaticus]